MPMTKANVEGLLLKSPKLALGSRTPGDDGPLPGAGIYWQLSGEEFEEMTVASRPVAA